jgi:hypothetical protein
MILITEVSNSTIGFANGLYLHFLSSTLCVGTAMKIEWADSKTFLMLVYVCNEVVRVSTCFYYLEIKSIYTYQRIDNVRIL